MFSSRTILLPVGTFANGNAQPSVVPVIEDQIGGMYADSSGNANISTINSSNVYKVACSTVASAYNFIQQIRNFLYSHSQGTFSPVITSGAALTWVSSSPLSITRNTSGLFTITGTGFLASGVNAIKWDDGAGVILVSTPTIVSDVTMTVLLGQFPNALDDGFIWSSVDGGATWVNTMLVIAVT